MNSDEIQNDNIKSSLMKIETLQKEYEVTLQQYQEAGKNYISLLENESVNTNANANTNTNKWKALKGRTWWGTSALSEGTVETQEECETMCANSSECSGATFNPVKRYCWTRSGESSITVGTDDDYALVTQEKSALTTMKYLNERLIELNKEIASEIKSINPQIKEQYEEKNEKQYLLDSSYENLLEQKRQLDNQLQEYYSMEQEEDNSFLYVNQQNMTFKMLLLVACILLLAIIKSTMGTSAPISIIVKLMAVIVLIVLTYSLSSPSGFFMWFIVLIGAIIINVRG
jgi:chromosome segregation ATPase